MGTKIWYVFFGLLALSRIFLGYCKELVVPWLRSSANKVQTNVFCCCLIVPGMGFFGGLNFGPGIFWGFAGSPRDFFGS